MRERDRIGPTKTNTPFASSRQAFRWMALILYVMGRTFGRVEEALKLFLLGVKAKNRGQFRTILCAIRSTYLVFVVLIE